VPYKIHSTAEVNKWVTHSPLNIDVSTFFLELNNSSKTLMTI